MVKLPVGHTPGSPLLWRVRQGKQRDNGRLDRSRDVHRPRVVRNGEISGLDQRADLWERQRSGAGKRCSSVILLHSAKHLFNQYSLRRERFAQIPQHSLQRQVPKP